MNAKKNVPEDMTEILIVEDSPTQAEQLKHFLEKHHYKVLVANNGKQALALLDKHKPALVISDIIMPEMNGYQLCRRIKSVKSKEEIPVILLTSLSAAGDVLDGLECGADNFITKPYSEEYLLLHVEQIIANRKLFRNERVRVGLEIMFGGKRRFVTADQQQMLTLLISTYEEAVRKNAELVKTQNMYKELNARLSELVKERTAVLSAEIEERKRAEEALLDSETRYRALFMASADGIGIADSDAKVFMYVNPALCRMLGYTENELINMNIADIHPKDALQRVLAEFEAQARGEKTLAADIPCLRKDGTILYADINTVNIAIGGRPYNVGHFRDITERKRAEERIRKLNRVYAMLSNINQAIVRVREPQLLFKEACRIAVEDGSFHMAWIGLADPGTGNVNPVASAGVTGSYLEKVHIVLGDEAPQGSGPIGRVLKAGEHVVCNDMEHDPNMAPWREDAFRMGFRSCAAFPLTVSGQVRGALKLYAAETGFFDDEELKLLDELAMDVSFAMEFTEKEAHRRQAEEALRKSERRLKEAQAIAFMGDWEFDIASQKITWSDQVYRMYERDPAIGPPTPEEEAAYYTPEQAALLRQFAQQVIDTGIYIDYEFVAGLPSGKTPVFAGSMRPVKNDAGKVIKVFGTLQDITERKQGEEKQKKLEDQLRQSQKLEAIGQLAGGVAHDFNNLLGGIMGNAELIKMHSGKDPAIDRYSDIVINSSAKAADLTRQLLTFARKVRVNFTKVNIHAGIENVIELLAHTIDRRIEIVKKFGAASEFVNGDSNMLENALLNIAINARDAMPAGGTLSFATDNVVLNDLNMPRFAPELTTGEYVRVTIRDTGLGMDDKTMLRIFEPFFTTKEVGKGTGLGLAAVYGCVRQHKGHVMVESEPGKGSAFIIYLPVLLVNERQSGRAAQVCVQGKGNILIIDDEQAIGEVAVELLNGIGYTPTFINSAAKAIEYFEKNHGSVDAVILDIIMPKMNGLDVFRELKRLSPGVRVIIASGYSDEKQDALLVAEGATVFVSKPYMLSELSTALAEVLGKQDISPR